MKWSPILCLIYSGLCLAQYLEGIVDREKCDKLGGPGTYEKLKVASEKLRTCVYESFNVATFKREIYEAQKTGTLDKIIPKYGNSIKDVNTCLKDYVEIAKLCLTKEEKRVFITFVETLRKGVNHLFENDGHEIIEFIEDEGIECVKSSMSNCYMDNPSCKNFEKFKSCTVQELRDNCPSIAPADIVEELLQYVESSICTDNKKIIRYKRSLRRTVRDVMGLEKELTDIEKAIKEDCVENGVPAEKLDKAVVKMKKCLKQKKIFTTPEEEYLEHLDNCTKDGVKTFTECLPEEQKYLPKLLYKLSYSLIRFLYEDYEDIALGLGPCLNKLKSDLKSKVYYDLCRMQVRLDHHYNAPQSQAEFCDQFIPISKCFLKQINDTCEHNELLDKFSKNYLVALEDPCKSTT